MKVVFAGPSLANTRLDGFDAITFRGPAGHGDMLRALQGGATVMGLIDGVYERVAAVWHKEILLAIEQGVTVYGGASMGALRAAECADFGMIGVGEIYRRYRNGALDDDAAVAQIHAPAEFGHAPLTEALVNVLATLDHVAALALVTRRELVALSLAARRIFFKDRTFPEVVGAAIASQDRRREVEALLDEHRIDLKAIDAVAVVEAVDRGDAQPRPSPDPDVAPWVSRTATLRCSLEQIGAASEARLRPSAER